MKYYSESGLEIFYGTEHSAGLDLPYYDPNVEKVVIEPGERAKLSTGVYLEIPENHVGIMDNRSSTSKLKLDLLCRIIDCDFRGNIHIVYINNGSEKVVVNRGDYLAQIVIVPYTKMSLEMVDSPDMLSKTNRGSNGFGHTTVKREGI